jgi:hypothetical protein
VAYECGKEGRKYNLGWKRLPGRIHMLWVLYLLNPSHEFFNKDYVYVSKASAVYPPIPVSDESFFIDCPKSFKKKGGRFVLKTNEEWIQEKSLVLEEKLKKIKQMKFQHDKEAKALIVQEQASTKLR